MNYDALFETTCIGNCRLKNRFAMAPLGPLGLGDFEGGWTQRAIEYYSLRAKGGVGLIHTGITFVDNEIEKHAVGNCPCSTQNPTHFIRTSRELTERVHAYGAKIFLQMTGGFGRVTIPKSAGFNPPVAPSPIQHRWKDVNCRELTLAEIHTLVKRFGQGARYAKEAGFDGVQIHAVHEGYLLDQFAMALFNHRADEYGGCLENRLRIVREIVDEIHSACGENFPVTMRYSPKSFIKAPREGALPGEKFEEAGRDLPEGLQVARLLEKYGYAALDVDVGSYDSWWWSHPPMYQKKGLYMEYAAAVKQVVSIPVICAGRMDNPNLAAQAVAQGACDIVSLGRPLLADPEIINKIFTGKLQQIRPCLSCQEGCMGRLGKYSVLGCAVNPACAREADMALRPALEKKDVLIMGGGPAGCEAARVLALRGHRPVLYESSPRLGGKLRTGGVPSFKADDIALADWYEQELSRLNVHVVKSTKATVDTIKQECPSVVIVATGGIARKAFEDSSIVITAEDALQNAEKVGENVVIAGGGIVACETALWLTDFKKKVTMIVRAEDILAHNSPICHANYEMLKKLVYYNGVRVIPNATVCSVAKDHVVITASEGKRQVNADTLITALGYISDRTIYDQALQLGKECYLLGDANRIANVMYAIWDAYELARNI